MVVKGIIQSIDLLNNTYKVRIPFYENVTDGIPGTYSGIISTPPGITPDYKVNDVVILSFDEDTIDNPVILGKLYLNKLENKGSINCINLNCSGTAEIPINTILNYDHANDIANSNESKDTYKTISDVIEKVQMLNNKLYGDVKELTFEKLTNIHTSDLILGTITDHIKNVYSISKSYKVNNIWYDGSDLQVTIDDSGNILYKGPSQIIGVKIIVTVKYSIDDQNS